MNNDWLRVSLALLFILGIILVLSWLVKRLNGINFSTSKGFQLIASMTLGPKEKLMLVQVGGRYLLMGVGSASVTMLHDFGQDLPQGFEPDKKQSLGELIKSSVRKP